MKPILKLILFITLSIYPLQASEESPTQEEVAKLYVATFNRAPDPGGLSYWTNDSFDGNPTLSGIARSFFDQPETQTLYPEGTFHRDFIQSVYQNLFNREPDTAGWNYWEGELTKGAFSKNSFIIAVINGALDNDDGLDATILENKTIVGLSFSEAGLTDLDDAKSIMSGVSADATSMSSAVASFGISLYGDIPSSNIAPIANAGDDQNVSTYTGITLEASNSYDTDGSISSYEWVIEGITVSTDVVWTNSFSPGNYTVLLRVTDNDGETATDTVMISVTQSILATAKISASSTNVIYKTTVDYLEALGSYDPEGVVLWIGWQYDDEGGYTMGSLSEKHILNTFLVPGSHTVKLMLFDYDGKQIATDIIDIIIGFATPEPIYGCPLTGTSTVETVMDDGAILTCGYFSGGVEKGRLSYEARRLKDQYGYYLDGYQTTWQDKGFKSSQNYWQNKEATGAHYDLNGEITSCNYPDGSSCMP